MAWRDSRRNRGRLLLFISSIILGIAALVAINSFSENLQYDIEREAKTLLGADLMLEGSNAPPDSLMELIDSIAMAGEKAEVIGFASMAYFPKGEYTRLSYIKAQEGDYPFYGKISTVPETASQTFKTGKKALVDKSMMVQFNLSPGDSVKVGNVTFEIEGQINSAPGSSGITSAVAPVVMIPKAYLEATGLMRMGSRIEYQHFFKLSEQTDVAALTEAIKPRVRNFNYRYSTVESRKANVSRAFDSLANFLNLIGFIALLLGCIGVASAVHIYIKDKLSTVAILRTLGASGQQAFWIYLMQIIVMGTIGAIIGAAIGSFLQVVIPKVLADFLPLQNVSSNISFSAIFQGVVTGLGIAVLFALLPLLAIRKTSPLRTLRASYEEAAAKRDPLSWLVYALIFIFILVFSWFQTGGGWKVIFFPIGVFVSFLVLAGIAKLVMVLVKKFMPRGWSYVWRQSIANLYRPNNQTLILIVSIGLGTTLISTLFFVQDLLLQQVQVTGSGNMPNIILFDIQNEQKEEVAELTRSFNLPVLQQVPIVTTRIQEVNGVSKLANEKDTINGVRGWLYRREFRITYRDSLMESEKIVEGEWSGEKLADGTIPVSISQNIAEDINAFIGMPLTFNIQGAIVKTVVGSIRSIEWDRMQTNFFVVFPKGVLEKAPQFHVVISRSDDSDLTAKFQHELVMKFPNVSAIDLSTVLQTVDNILTKVSFVIRFMALFSILTGIMVLISSVVLSKYQRIRESVLLRTLGASSKQILSINALEYLLLGALASATGIVLSFIASWIQAKFVFDIPFKPNLLPPFLVFLGITLLTVFIGVINSRGILNTPPLEVLRKEVG